MGVTAQKRAELKESLLKQHCDDVFLQSTALHILLTKYKNIKKHFLFQGKIYEDDGLVSI